MLFIWFFDKSCVPETVLHAKSLLLLVALFPHEALSTGFVKEGLL